MSDYKLVEVKTEDLHRPSIEVARNNMESYSMAFVYDTGLQGSGTLAKLDDRYGILTCQHVAKALMDSRTEKFFIPVETVEHSFWIEKKWIKVIEVPGYKTHEVAHGGRGSDLAFVELLHPANVRSLKVRKSFYDLNRIAQEGLTLGPSPEGKLPGVLIGGWPDELSGERESVRGNGPVLEAIMMTAPAFVRQYFEKEGFDYALIDIASGPGGELPPEDFGGVSGGGVWIPVVVTDVPGGTPMTEEARGELVGVVWYQSDHMGDRRQLVVHGPRSITGAMRDAIRASGCDGGPQDG